jgi:radical SAM protein with 4Fe4S-binding SPASM domain
MNMTYDDVLNTIQAPVRISFEPTIGCNLRCPMCDRLHKEDYLSHRDNQLPYETAKAFLHEVGALGVRYFLFIGGGEPLMEPHLIEYIQILKSYGVYVHLWTNGTLINSENAPALAQSCDMITVSLDSPDPAVNDLSRGAAGATEKAIEGIRLLRKHSDTLFLRIHSVISALNLDSLIPIADFASDNGVTEIGGALIAPFDFIPENMRFSSEQLSRISNRIEALCEYAKTKGVALAGCYANVSAKIIQNLSHIHHMYTGRAAPSGRHITCMGLWGQATVRPNGDVSVCCFTYKPVLGNLHNHSFKEIWNSARANELRELVRRGEYIDAPCVGCDTGHPVFTEDLILSNSLDSYFEMSINAR